MSEQPANNEIKLNNFLYGYFPKPLRRDARVCCSSFSFRPSPSPTRAGASWCKCKSNRTFRPLHCVHAAAQNAKPTADAHVTAHDSMNGDDGLPVRAPLRFDLYRVDGGALLYATGHENGLERVVLQERLLQSSNVTTVSNANEASVGVDADEVRRCRLTSY